MNLFCNIALSLIFLCIGGIHIYWAFGGNWGKQQAVPTTPEGTPLFTPSFFSCFGVGIILLSFILLMNNENLDFISPKVSLYSKTIVAIIFLMRAIGDFKYVGFFKKINGTEFARLDGKYYTPVCLIIFILIIIKLIII
ncbi:DUF3995 domain-containing protein [Chryseobacterium potabilaquae]|uniref:DUF3995 domain-containing protein n=1 Tax=Chryseobacterium potabilaquae TaxID=2675057 RepID=A0A6N4X7X3_9FLAO|nr:DUF3995 domain-containing protein [Chryseobacterium potabilaquae]CAA7195551.1 hypothetical protein CHRY9293_01738 [Chryseobacterium potabilaquae]